MFSLKPRTAHAKIQNSNLCFKKVQNCLKIENELNNFHCIELWGK